MGMSWVDYLQFFVAFAFVLALIGVVAVLARRFGLGYTAGSGGERRLSISEAIPLDAKHRLVLVRRDDVEHLLVLGPTSATVIEPEIAVLAPPSFSAVLAGASE